MKKSDTRVTSPEEHTPLSRRRLLASGGMAVAGLALSQLVPSALAQEEVVHPLEMRPLGAAMLPRGIVVHEGGTKPVIVPGRGTMDVGTLSKAESLFWLDQLAEHAAFIALFLATPETVRLKAHAQKWQTTLARQLENAKVARLERSDYRSFNRGTAELVKPFIDFQLSLAADQTSGRIRSLGFPTFYQHVAEEAQHYLARLDRYDRGHAELDAGATIAFWSKVMGEHALMIAHLLDPTEERLVGSARDMAMQWKRMQSASRGEVAALLRQTIDFKSTAGKGIVAGTVKSIIPPTLADHVRREAVKFESDLERV